MTSTKTAPAEAKDVQLLLVEIRRYLAAVETFRREGHEPRWAPEPLGPGRG